jgi:hypothetical protein
MKPTPGPWAVGYGKQGVTGPRAAPHVYWEEEDCRVVYIPIRREKGMEVIAWVAASSGSKKDLMPDARLISAAPELLEALKLLLRYATPAPGLAYEWNDAMDKSRAAIAKTEGRD